MAVASAAGAGGIVPAWIQKQIEIGRNRVMAHTAPMTYSTGRDVRAQEIVSRITALGHRVLRYGLALVIGWIGMMKFTGYEAQGIEPLVAHSPLLGWMYRIWTVRQLAAGLGVVEIFIAILIALRPWSRKASAIGSAAAVLMFLTTLSFLFSTPGWEPSLGGFPALSGAVGQFLIKDVVLLGAAIWSLGEALTA
jgi:reactive chlorine resistance protein C